jgi:hypothetical protein
MKAATADDIVIDARSGRVDNANAVERTGNNMIASRSPFWLQLLEAATLVH